MELFVDVGGGVPPPIIHVVIEYICRLSRNEHIFKEA